MDDLLTPIRITSIKTSSQDESQIDLKLASSTSTKAARIVPVIAVPSGSRKPSSFENAVEILRSQPSRDELSATLDYILQSPVSATTTDEKHDGFSITSISALSSRIISAIIVDVIPTFWGIFTSSTSYKSERNKLVKCLHSVSGLGGVIARLKILLKQVPSSNRPKNVTLTKVDVDSGTGQAVGVHAQIRDLMDILGLLLRGNRILQGFWEDLKYTPAASTEDRKREMAWKEFLGLIAGGKVLSVAAEADLVISETADTVERRKSSWIGVRKEYTSWLRDNIMKMVDEASLDDDITWSAISSIIARGFGLGSNENVIDLRLYLRISELNPDLFARIRRLLLQFKEFERATYINTLLKLLSQQYLPVYLEGDKHFGLRVSLVAKIIHELCITEEGLQKGFQDILLDWILVNGGAGGGEPIGIRRAIIVALNESSDGPTIIRDSLSSQVDTFGEKIWIKHAPIIHQEVNAQCLILCAGYVHRRPPSYLKIVSRSSPFMNGVSNHLASTNLKVRFLGMVVGETISSLVDLNGKQLKFADAFDGSPEEAEKWKNLVNVKDSVPGYEIFKDSLLQSNSIARVSKKPKAINKSTKKTGITEVADINSQSSILIGNRIEELDTDSDDDDDDIIPYPKPDSDPEDSDDDATLIKQKKLSSPVYIRDLLYMLYDHESFDKQQLALSNAAVLIRRKASFGSEVSAHAVELLTVLAGLQDQFEMENFDDMRLKAIVALVVVLPLLSGPWISQRIFEGDYSLAQKCVLLSAIGIAAMELAGEEIPDDSPLFQFQLSNVERQKAQFPSKRLPQQLHDVYSSTPVDTINNRLKNTILQPIAAKAADEVSGPNILKIRTFSSRMEVEARTKKPGVNKLSQIVVDAFFGPLMGRWWVFVKDYGATSAKLIPHLLSLYIKTLTVLLHSTGPNNLAIPQMTDSFWDLLLSLRHSPITLENSTVLDAILVGLLTIFDVCGEDRDKRRMAEERGKELVETQEWVTKVFEGSTGAEGSGETRNGLAAAVLLRCREVVERYERLLMGELISQ